jgi:excisionase family DNA binding protein
MTTNEALRDVLTPEQAADYLQVNKETIYRYIRDGRLLASRLGRAYRIPRSSLEALLWSSSTRPDISLREYTSREIGQFMDEDQLTGSAKGVANRLTRIMESNSKPK